MSINLIQEENIYNYIFRKLNGIFLMLVLSLSSLNANNTVQTYKNVATSFNTYSTVDRFDSYLKALKIFIKHKDEFENDLELMNDGRYSPVLFSILLQTDLSKVEKSILIDVNIGKKNIKIDYAKLYKYLTESIIPYIGAGSFRTDPDLSNNKIYVLKRALAIYKSKSKQINKLKTKKSPLYYAVLANDEDMIRYLIANKLVAIDDAKTIDHILIYKFHLLKLFVELVFDINKIDISRVMHSGKIKKKIDMVYSLGYDIEKNENIKKNLLSLHQASISNRWDDYYEYSRKLIDKYNFTFKYYEWDIKKERYEEKYYLRNYTSKRPTGIVAMKYNSRTKVLLKKYISLKNGIRDGETYLDAQELNGYDQKYIGELIKEKDYSLYLAIIKKESLRYDNPKIIKYFIKNYKDGKLDGISSWRKDNNTKYQVNYKDGKAITKLKLIIDENDEIKELPLSDNEFGEFEHKIRDI